MYIKKDDADKIYNSYKQELIDEYRSKLHFITDLLKDDDWSFVIKSHSLIESLLNDLLNQFLGKPELLPFIERLPLHGEDISKVGLIKKMNLLDPKKIRFIKLLSEIRNRIVHKFENINFTFDSYILSLDETKLKTFKSSLFIRDADNKISEILFRKDAKLAFWDSVFISVVELIDKINRQRGLEKIDEISKITSEQILKEIFDKY